MCNGDMREGSHCDRAEALALGPDAQALQAEIDILRQAHEAAFRVAEDIDDLYQGAPCAFCVTDTEGTIRNINDTGLRWLGLSREAVAGRMGLRDIVSRAAEPALASLRARLGATGAAHNVDLQVRRGDGSCFSVLADASAGGTPPAWRIVLYDITERKAAEGLHSRRVRRRREMAQALAAVQERERRRLSEELYARTSPNLAAVRINLDLIVAGLAPGARRKLADRIEDTLALLADASSSVGEICMDLRPGILDHAGLLPALSCYAQRFSARTGIRVCLEPEEAGQRLSADVESMLFRTAQDALDNCARHARAEAVGIRVDFRDRGASLTISDDGIGFDAANPAGPGVTPGLGLVAMRERAESAGGRFFLESRPGQGTTIRVEVQVGAGERTPSG